MIAIPAFHHTDTKSHNVTLPHALAMDLELYRQFYSSAYGADVKDADLLREIVRCFLEQDEGFRAFKRQAKSSNRQRRSPAAKSSPSELAMADASPLAKRLG